MAESDCVSIPCCPDDPYDYAATDGEDSLAGNVGAECPDATVTSEPASGSYIFFPTYVILTSNNVNALIYYTVDGTEPTVLSTLYTVPFQVTQSGTQIKARAFLEGCGLGPVLTVQYQNSPFEMGFDYSCITPDHGGTWDVWAPNGNIDSFWQLEFTLTDNQEITRLEMRQLGANGLWTTGVIYSTDSPLIINDAEFDVMPFLIFIGAVQQFVAYQETLGTYGAGTHTWDLYGDKQFSSDGGFWQLSMVLADGSILTAIKTTNCSNVVNPEPCPSPAAPTVTPLCDGAVDVIFANANPQNYKIYLGATTLVSSGTTSASPETVNVTGLTPGVAYQFRVELDYGNPCGYQSSMPITAVPLADPEVSIASDKLVVDPSESFTISWTSTNVGGVVCAGCFPAEVSISQGIGCQTGNVAGSQATSQATPGLYTYEITGCNACGTVTASVQVEVVDSATCGVQPATVSMSNPTTFLCGFIDSCSIAEQPVAWNGVFTRISNCVWRGPSGLLRGYGCIGPGGQLLEGSGTISIPSTKWLLVFSGASLPNHWTGEKLTGNSPVGVYTRTGGCATGPASITIT